ncbi:ImmA/IrrE family metallo-endopeptidase [Mycobacterium marinum]|nr:ImmA/IrrE family metallo-endopeptidase [Mycobacterium marinum]MDC8980970.1 ImmA/IrrE family metallo-endopeptidase [Mycobacterium marinum]MDC8999280.1 ImmA/IrrE family metallo-endopeptidase [Mycobacterium marinum]MDC9009851.1 ImmA/IrrE family metallo-endopeptidase [Mycobacterium marinum]
MTAPRNPVAEAQEVLMTHWADSGGNLSFPVDPVKIARQMGAAVFLDDLQPGVSGQLEADDWGQTILLSCDNGPNRQRFTCAHEIGHMVDRNLRGGPPVFTDYRDGRASEGTDAAEIYANQFAAELLMPAEHVRNLAAAGWSTQQLASRFGVSQAAMSIRRDNLRCA